MKTATRLTTLPLAGAVSLLVLTTGAALAVNDEPLRDKWAPSEWGPPQCA